MKSTITVALICLVAACKEEPKIEIMERSKPLFRNQLEIGDILYREKGKEVYVIWKTRRYFIVNDRKNDTIYFTPGGACFFQTDRRLFKTKDESLKRKIHDDMSLEFKPESIFDRQK